MAEYIERTEALEITTRTCGDYAAAWSEIRKLPAADVAPVVHGRWLTWEEMFPGKTPKKKNNLGVFCSSCKNHADNMFASCPNCGARMDGESNGKAD